MKRMVLDLMEMRDEDIDCSDIPKVTDFSGWHPLKPRVDAMRAHDRATQMIRISS